MAQRTFKPSFKNPPVGRAFNGRKDIDNMYDKTWEAYRLKFLEVNPRCYSCGDRATVVDHLTPHQGDQKLFKQTDNHIPLCVYCHNKVTAIFDKRFRAGNSVEPKIRWFVRNREERGLTTRVRVLPQYG